MVVGEGVEKRMAQAGLSNFLKHDFQVRKSYAHMPDFKTHLGSDHLRRISVSSHMNLYHSFSS